MKLMIGVDHNSTDVIFLQKEILERFSLTSSTYRMLAIGTWQKTVQVREIEQIDSSQAKQNEIYLSKNIIEDSNIPIQLTYEIEIKEQQIQIGPVIGILMSGKKANVTERQLRGYTSYFTSYPQINGLIISFTYDAIIWEDKKVDGYAYDSDTQTWQEGIFPFPSSFYSRKDIDLSMNSQLTELIGRRFFNSYTFSKLEMWEWLSANDETKVLLPETAIFEEQSDLTQMLNKYNKIFIKPIWGMRGLGIYQLEKRNSDFILQYRLDEENKSEVFHDEQEVSEYLFNQTRRRKYLIQQYIPLLEIDERKLDIRAIMQKSFNGTWELQGMVTRFGPKESIVSNISRGGYAEVTWQTLKNIYDDDQAKAYQKWKEIEKAAIKVCQQLEQTGFLFGNLGLDIGIDDIGHLWIIEINNRYPDPTIAFDADDPHLYYKIRSNPLKYAKWLAGFEGGCL